MTDEKSGLDDVMNGVDNSLVEKLWRELDGQVSRQQIAGAVTEIAAGFAKATVTAFVPIFIHREALEQLKGLLANTSHVASSGSPPDDE
jgi:hypothetical protein